MPPLLGRTRAVGLGKETTPGVTVAPTHWLPQQDLTLEDRVDRIYDNSGLGTRYGAFAGDTDMERGEGNINGLIYDRSFGHIALAAMGSVSSAAHGTATGVRVHTFSVGSSLPTYTIALKDGNEDVRAGYGMLNSLEISAEQGQYARFTSSWLTRKSATASNTVAFTDQNRFRPQDVTLKIADDVASLGAAPALRMSSMTLTINNNLITEPSLGTVNPDYYPGVVETSIDFGRVYLDTTLKSLVFGTTKKALQIAFTRTDVSIGTGTPTNPSIVFTFEPGFFSDWGREGGLDDLKRETSNYMPLYSTAASKQFGLVITNTETAY
jgi:hypothetical protein